MGSIFYCTELSVSCWYCNANEGNLHLVISEAPEAILYVFGENEETDIKEEEIDSENKVAIAPSALPLLFPLVHSETNQSAEDGISNFTTRKPIRKNAKIPIVFNLK